MAGKGTYAALQQLRPSTAIDLSKGIVDANMIYLRMNQDRRSEQTSMIEQQKYDEERRNAFMTALEGDLSKIDAYRVSTGYKQPDEALTKSLLDTKQKLIDLYSSPEYLRRDPKAIAEKNRLLSKPQFLSGVVTNIKTGLEDLDQGMKPTVDKNGNSVLPRYSKAAVLQLNKWKGLANGQFDFETIDGRDYAVIYNDDGQHNFVDMQYFNTNGLKDSIPSYFDFNAYLKMQRENLGEKVTVTDSAGNRTITNKSFDDIRPMVEQGVDKLLGGSAANLTNEGLSLLADHYNFDLAQISSFNDATYGDLKSFVISQIEKNYKEEYKDEFNKDEFNAYETQRHHKATEANTAFANQTDRIKTNNDVKKTDFEIKKELKESGASATTLNGKTALNYSLNKTLEISVPGQFGTDKKIKVNSFTVVEENGHLAYYATDGKNSFKVDNPQRMLDGSNLTATKISNQLNDARGLNPSDNKSPEDLRKKYNY